MGGYRVRSTIVILFVLALQITLASCAATEKQSTIEPPTVSLPKTASPAAGEPKPGGVLVISYGGGTPRHFNPALASGSSTAIVGTQIFASPLRYDENWNPQPYLAQSWEISDDGLAVTLHLVEGATFHDGQPITAEDVAFSVQTVKAYHPFKPMFAPVEEVETPDPHTAVIRLSRPHPALLLAMSPALLPILPKHVYGDGQDLPTHPANLEPIGSGPFRLVEYTPDELIRLERYDGYFFPGRPYLDQIVIRLEPDPDIQVIDMQRQEAHLLAVFTNLAGLDRLGDCPHLVVTQRGNEGIGSINWLAFNLLHEPLDDKRVRQAIAYAVDPEFIIAHLHQGRTRRANSPISPDSPFYDSTLPTYQADLDKANKLLDEAGYPLQPGGTRFSLTLDYIPVIPSQQRDVALYLEHQLARIGIEVQVRRSSSLPEWAERIGNWDFDLTMDIVYNWGDPVIGVHRTYLCNNIRQGVVWSNTQNYCNPRVDELLQQAEREPDPAQRKALYSEFQQIVTEELPVYWINSLPAHTVYHNNLGNPPLSIWGVHAPLDEIYWQEPPSRGYAPLPSLEDESPEIKRAGVQALKLLQELSLYDAQAVLNDPEQGFLDLEGSGLHIIGLTRAGVVFVDNSGQMKPGIDINDILNLEGDSVISLFLRAADGEHDGFVDLAGTWPHPGTHKVGLMTAWCGVLSEQDVICALAWEENEEGRK
jgi:peptide/nickel transport system substrate-binding protein